MPGTDIRIASDRANFGIAPGKIGIVYPTSGIERLVRLVGPGGGEATASSPSI